MQSLVRLVFVGALTVSLVKGIIECVKQHKAKKSTKQTEGVITDGNSV